MRISRRKTFHKPEIFRRYHVNSFIRTPQVRLIDENGENLGVVATSQALSMAQEKGLDLVEVSPLAQPPVAKIINYSKLKYQEEKERRKEKAKQKKIEVKGIRLSLRISPHDIEIRLNQAKKFIGLDDKVRVEMLLKGRERQHFQQAREIINKFVADLNELIPVNLEQPLAAQGGKLSVLIGKK
ncbi:MAG TPA: translation initiation factor IF-3 [Patescibacteria group bacterium]|nr:translation initiation factor IF-3 [Patescibacteria group bacterium]